MEQPIPHSFFTVSGDAATRVSNSAVSLGIAMVRAKIFNS